MILKVHPCGITKKKINYKILEHLVNLCEEVQKICCFSYLKSALKKIYVGSDSFALQNGLTTGDWLEIEFR
jgi:hypothetical protein